jgi:hypothetical protein
MALALRAVRNGAVYNLFMDASTRPFGTLGDAGLVSDYDSRLVYAVNAEIESLVDLRDRLATVRKYVELLHAEWDAESAAEQYAEGAWLRNAEYDPEADAFEDYERRNGVIPFDVAYANAKRAA